MIESGYFLTLPQIFRALRRRWMSGALLAGLIVAAALSVVLCLRDTYESEGRFYVRAGRSTHSLDPTATTGQTISMLQTPQAEVQSIKEMLTSRKVIEEAIEDVGVDRILEHRSTLSKMMDQLEPYKFWKSKDKDENLIGRNVADLERMEECVSYVSKKLGIKADKNGKTITISAEAHTPVLAHDIVDSIMKRFNDHYITIHRSQDSLDFFKTEFASAKQRLSDSEKNLRDLKNEKQLISIVSKRALLQDELTALQTEMITTTGNLRASNAREAELKTMLGNQPQYVDAQQTNKANDASNLMRDQLFEMEVQESDLLAKYNEQHPSVVKIRESIAAARRAFETQSKTSEENTKTVNPIFQQISLDLLESQAESESLSAKLEIVKGEMDNAMQRMATLNSDELLILEAERQVDLARRDFTKYSDKFEEARIQQALDEQAISDLAVDEPATLVMEESGPMRALLMAAATLAGIGAGLAFAIFRDQSEYSKALANATLIETNQSQGQRVRLGVSPESGSLQPSIGSPGLAQPTQSAAGSVRVTHYKTAEKVAAEDNYNKSKPK